MARCLDENRLFKFLVFYFNIRNSALQLTTPIYQPIAPINQPLLIQPHKSLHHRSLPLLIHCKHISFPVSGDPHSFLLISYSFAIYVFPFENSFNEFRAAEIVTGFFVVESEGFFDYGLGGYSGVVAARDPDCEFSAHSVPASH